MQTPRLVGAQRPCGGGLLDWVVVNNLQQFHMIYVYISKYCYKLIFSRTYGFNFRQKCDDDRKVYIKLKNIPKTTLCLFNFLQNLKTFLEVVTEWDVILRKFSLQKDCN